MIGIKTAWRQVKEEIRAKAYAEGLALGHTEGRAAAYAELKAKTLSEIAAELGIDAPPRIQRQKPAIP